MLKLATKTALLTALLTTVAIFGSILAIKDIYPISNISRKLIALNTNDREIGRVIETTLIDLKIASAIKIPESKNPQGGDLTNFGSETILLTNDGLIYSIIEKEIKIIDLKAPQNGYAEYAETVKTRTKAGKKHNPLNLQRLRYNGILIAQADASKYLLISYIEWNSPLQCYRNVIDSITLQDSIKTLREIPKDVSWTRLYSSQPCLPLAQNEADLHGHTSGGKIADLGNGRIVIANGDFEWDGVSLPFNPAIGSPPLSQDLASDYGKVLEINLKTKTVTRISSGNRNMQGIAVSPAGSIWTTEHGPRGGDKLNLHVKDRNFGWPIRTYGTQYSKLPWPGALPYGRMDAFSPPAFAWVPSVAVSDVTYIRNFDPSWDGDLLIGSLKAASLFRVRIEGENGVYAEQIPIGDRIRSVITTPKNIVIWTDSNKLLFIEKTKYSWTVERVALLNPDTIRTAKSKENLKNAVEACAQCHSFEPNNHSNAPSINGLIGRKIGGSSFASTSEALKNRSGNWTKELLTTFLRDPSSFVPGTTMPNPGLDDDTSSLLASILANLNGTVDQNNIELRSIIKK